MSSRSPVAASLQPPVSTEIRYLAYEQHPVLAAGCDLALEQHPTMAEGYDPVAGEPASSRSRLSLGRLAAGSDLHQTESHHVGV